MSWIEKSRKDVREILEQAVNGLPDERWRELRWKTACLPGPVAVGDGNVSPMLATRLGVWRSELQKKLRKLEGLASGSVISRVPGQAEEKAQLEGECDALAQLIEEAEDAAPTRLLPKGAGRLESVAELERVDQGPFDGGRFSATRTAEETKRLAKLRRSETR